MRMLDRVYNPIHTGMSCVIVGAAKEYAMDSKDYDIVIVGGGPAGSTCGAMLRTYNKDLSVLIIERENFPRDHVGESQLPPIQRVLQEIGVWDKVEAAEFPIKIGASYTWGMTTEPWEFEFLPLSEVKQDQRPAAYEGWRQKTAFQVDRAIYDKILLDHAEELGCKVWQGKRVAKVHHTVDEITQLELEDGTTVTGKHYVDASGNAAVIRRGMGVKIDTSSKLQNVAFWDYWDGVDLNSDLFGHGVTRVQVRSLPNGWIWYIPLSNSRASVGFVCPAEYYKQQKKTPKELYMQALEAEPRVASLLTHAKGHEKIESTTDWSFLAERACGKNWTLTGETMGFADPVLAAGLTLTHYAARHCAYALLEQFRGEHDRDWLWEQYEKIQVKRVLQHMRFAEYWYSANGCFEDLREFCQEIASDAGLNLSPAKAFQWLSNGGLDDFPGEAVLGGFNVPGIKQVQWRLTGDNSEVKYTIRGKNVFKLNLAGATKEDLAHLEDGRIQRRTSYKKGNFVLPLVGHYEVLVEALQQTSDLEKLIQTIAEIYTVRLGAPASGTLVNETLALLEPLANNYFVTCSTNKKRPVLNIESPKEGQYIYSTSKGEPDHD